MRRLALLALTVFLGVCPLLAAGPPPVRSPWDQHPVAVTEVPDSCPVLPSVPPDLTTESFYSPGDATHSIIDPARMAAYTESSGPAKAAAAEIIAHADRYRTTGSRAAAFCTMTLLAGLASQNALAGHMSSGQAYYVQGWLAGAMAVAFLKTRQSGFATSEQSQAIAQWLQRLGLSMRAWYDKALARKPLGNNHLYWAGFELCAIAAVANDHSDLDWGIAAYRNGTRQIAADGSLPLESARGSRALHYHFFALAPLVLIAEFGELNGVPLYAENDYALARLEHLCVSAFGDATPFGRQSGLVQQIPVQAAGDDIAWAPPYLARFPDPILKGYLDHATHLSSFYLGGLPAPVSQPSSQLP